MDKMTFGGIILGILAIGVGMVLKGTSPLTLFNPAALLIIFGGTFAAVMIAFPIEDIKKVPALFKIIFTDKQTNPSIPELIEKMSGWSDAARSEGILILEKNMADVQDPFMNNGLKMVIDGMSDEYIRDVLTEELAAMEERHAAGASIFRQAGTYAPTLGVLGAVVGLIAALGNMGDTDALGHAIAAAFVATLFGIFTGYVLWHPFANKLKEKSKKEVLIRQVMIEGLLSIQQGQSGRILRDKLASYLPMKERKAFLEKGEPENG